MKNKLSSLSVSVVLALLLWSVYFLNSPHGEDSADAPLSEFSASRALQTVQKMSEKPHFVGSENHEVVANYLIKELQNLGLQPSLQEGFTMTEKGTLVKSKNIIASIKGTVPTNKALLLLSHYDSAPHSYSYGASDDASGVATILESVRAFLHAQTKHKNDIVILFTDAEELGLNGAALFVTQHQIAKKVGLVLNLEARGSSGPGYMLMETTEGNSQMIDAFSNSGVTYPVGNSLMYSIYKMLPNDTDLTVFREKGKIQGFNFAFIDSHFNYHTQQDTFQHLDPNTLAHQGGYLFPLLNYFSNSDLSQLKSNQDKVYFNAPFYMVKYPFSWVIPMVLLGIFLFGLFIFLGIGKKIFHLKEVIQSFIPFLGSLFTASLITFFGWKIIKLGYPHYGEILQGFTYNGHDYVIAFISFSVAACFWFYRNHNKKNSEIVLQIPVLFIWLLLNLAIAFFLKGAAFLIIPVLASIIVLGYFVLTQKTNPYLNLVMSVPALLILVPLITMFPVGLGLKILVGSAILTVLCFGLLLPLFNSFQRKGIWATAFMVLGLVYLVKAHQSSDFVNGAGKPNSLVYILNADNNQANWATYDSNLDEWTKTYLGENPKLATPLNTNKLYSKYGSEYTFMAAAPLKTIPKPTIEFVTDSLSGNKHFYKIKITPNRKVNRYDVFTNEKASVAHLVANGAKALDIKSNIISKKSNKLLSYYVVDNIPLTLEFSIPQNQKLEFDLVESSFDLMSNTQYKMAPRKNWMLSKPFVLTDAVIIQQKIVAPIK
ncbi:M20/M25/M40 family metallo-hydrolase [Flavobacterium sp.]|uniref:M20/M25/M40 family metallo-hydrolase n=1 Tax=Flavobacterium sp. TaxID=239 RepID=UPI0038CF6C95